MSLPENGSGRNVMDTQKVDQHLAAKIVESYVRHQTVGAGQLTDLITTVHRALGELGQPNHPEELRTPAVSVRGSVHQDYVVCLDCGYRAKTLRRHINRQHGLSRDECRKRWGLRNDHPLTAPAYTERRSMLAKELGLASGSSGCSGCVSDQCVGTVRELIIVTFSKCLNLNRVSCIVLTMVVHGSS